MNTHDRAVQALMREVHDPFSWLSDAQNAQLIPIKDITGCVEFCGEGSIDVSHMVSIVLSEVEYSEDSVRMTFDEWVAFVKELHQGHPGRH